jgi:hypothetical protein
MAPDEFAKACDYRHRLLCARYSVRQTAKVQVLEKATAFSQFPESENIEN